MSIVQSVLKREIPINQSTYLKNILEKYEMEDCNQHPYLWILIFDIIC